MNDAPPKKRPWFQLHLSTCIVLMFVAGMLIWLNVTPRERSLVWILENGRMERFMDDRSGLEGWTGRGWPATFQAILPDETTKWSGEGVVQDLAVVMAIIGLAGSGCEYLIRRRERKRAAQEPAP